MAIPTPPNLDIVLHPSRVHSRLGSLLLLLGAYSPTRIFYEMTELRTTITFLRRELLYPATDIVKSAESVVRIRIPHGQALSSGHGYINKTSDVEGLYKATWVATPAQAREFLSNLKHPTAPSRMGGILSDSAPAAVTPEQNQLPLKKSTKRYTPFEWETIIHGGASLKIRIEPGDGEDVPKDATRLVRVFAEVDYHDASMDIIRGVEKWSRESSQKLEIIAGFVDLGH
jgi:hypothetical protein